MSVLTKVFVILLVVLSLVMASGLIVLVNKLEPYAQNAIADKAAIARANSRAQAAEQEAIAARGAGDARTLESEARAAAYRTALDTTQSEVARVQKELAGAQLAQATADQRAASAELAAQGAIKTVEAQQKVINDTAARLTTVEKNYTETQTRVAQLTQELDGARARIRRQTEEVAALTDQLDKAKAGGGRADAAAAAARGAGGGEAMQNLRGVVKARKNINGVEYATITLGSADSVTKGMRFKVVDRNNFLGYLTVDNVEPSESVGHLEGPNLNGVRPGTEVRTQW